MGPPDVALFRAINGWPDAVAPIFIWFSTATEADAVKVALAAMVIAMIARGPRSRVAILLALVAFPVANEITDLFKDLIPFARPFQELQGVNLRVGGSQSMGTASAHSANMAAIAFVLTAMLGRWGWIWVFVAFMTGLSRIVVGVHYPSQVLLGWLCGVLAGFVAVQTWKAYVRWKQSRQEVPTSAAPEA